MRAKYQGSVAPEEAKLPIIKVNRTDKAKYIFFNKLTFSKKSFDGQGNITIGIKDHIIFKKSYGIRDFKKDYNSFKGNAYGLANTLFQTAILKPSMRNKKLKNLYFCGQLTVPGPGVPPSIISGNVVAKELLKSTN